MNRGSRFLAALGWTAGTRFLAQLVSWGVSLVVMRILDPGDYGLLAMATVLIGFLNLFSELGLGWAVVQARQIDIDTLRKVYGLVLLVHAALFGLLFLCAPLIAAFFGEERLTLIVRVAGIHFLLVAPSVIPNSMLQRAMEFKWRSILGLATTVISAFVTLGFALYGYGMWSLVFGSLIGVALNTIGINLLHPFPHPPTVAFRGLRELFAFGGYVAISRILLYTYLQADIVIGGRVLGKEQIGYYSVGMQIASLPLQRVSAILNEVAFPAFARIQDDMDMVRNHVLKAIRLMSLCSVAVFWGICAVAPEVVHVILSDKWQPAVLPLQLLALVMPIRMIGQLMPPTLQGVGKAGLVARNQLLMSIAMVLAFIFGVQYGIVGLSIAWLCVFPFAFLANLATWLPVLRLQLWELLDAMGRSAIAGVGMLLSVAAVRFFHLFADGLSLVMMIVVGATTYAALSFAINREAWRDLRGILLRTQARLPQP